MNTGNVAANNGNNNQSLTNGSSNNNNLLRYNNGGANDYNLHTSQNGPRSLSDSSQAESPVQDDLLTSNTPNLGGTNGGNQNFNQNQNGYGGNGGNGACNGSIYPVLPASLLYTQLYTAANQSHSFHSHSLQSHSSQNSLMHGELQSVMDHIVTGTGSHGGGRHQQHQQLMAGNTDLSLIGNCGTAARVADDAARQLIGQRGQQQPPHGDNASVWRPY